MPLTALIDARKIVSFSGASTGAIINVTNPTGKLVFTMYPVSGSTEVIELPVTSFAGFDIPANVTLALDASLANGKAMYGLGTAIARARSTGEDLSGYSLFTDQIYLSDGVAYTITASQAGISQLGVSGVARDLRSSNSASKITVVATTSADLREIRLDRNDAITLSTGISYSLTGDQALIAKVGAGGLQGDLSAAGASLVSAAQGLDLSSLKLKATDTLELAPGQDYVLTSGLVAIARVGSGGTLGNLTTAGAITVKAALIGEDLSTLKALGLDVFELSAGKAYTVTADQMMLSRVGPSGALGDTKAAGVITVKAGACPDLSRLQTKSTDVIILDANADYRLTSDQAKISKVTATGKSGDLTAAGQITVVASPKGEDLSGFASKGVDFYDLSSGADYVLTTAQAKTAKVIGVGTLGDLRTAGNVTLIAQASENLALSPILGADEYRLLSNQTATLPNTLAYTLTWEQALKTRVQIGTVLGSYGDVSATKATVC